MEWASNDQEVIDQIIAYIPKYIVAMNAAYSHDEKRDQQRRWVHHVTTSLKILDYNLRIKYQRPEIVLSILDDHYLKAVLSIRLYEHVEWLFKKLNKHEYWSKYAKIRLRRKLLHRLLDLRHCSGSFKPECIRRLKKMSRILRKYIVKSDARLRANVLKKKIKSLKEPICKGPKLESFLKRPGFIKNIAANWKQK
jgi:hypothetical protein